MRFPICLAGAGSNLAALVTGFIASTGAVTALFVRAHLVVAGTLARPVVVVVDTKQIVDRGTALTLEFF